MTKEDYMKAQLEIVMLAKKVFQLPLEPFIAMIAKSHAEAPQIDAVLYKKAFANIKAMENLAKRMLDVKVQFMELQMAVIETTIKKENNDTKPQDEDNNS